MDQGARVDERVLGRFAHEAVFYDGAGDRNRALLPFIREGVAGGEPVLVALPPDAIEVLRAELGPADGVQFVDMLEVGGNPACIIPVWRRFVEEHAGHGRVRGIGEPAWAGRRDIEMVEAQLHEALLNLAFDGGPAWQLLCPYDVSRLPAWVINGARRTHPQLHAPGRPSTGYAGAEHAVQVFGTPLPDPPARARRFGFGIDDLGRVRDLVQAAALACGMASSPAEDLVLAAHELATNSILHADGTGMLLLWREPGALVVEVEDRGHITDPLVGRADPDREAMGGRGIWMVNQLCDLVQVRSSTDGTQVRLYAWLGAAAA